VQIPSDLEEKHHGDMISFKGSELGNIHFHLKKKMDPNRWQHVCVHQRNKRDFVSLFLPVKILGIEGCAPIKS
ncbi:hypothetical protein PIB30_076628, partial [Stylosanthes scabra]|nr:hypothetical protein [Stylosanthes scabra]